MFYYRLGNRSWFTSRIDLLCQSVVSFLILDLHSISLYNFRINRFVVSVNERMKQTIFKDNKPYCTTTVPYPPEVIKQMKKAGYKVKTIDDDKPTKT